MTNRKQRKQPKTDRLARRMSTKTCPECGKKFVATADSKVTANGNVQIDLERHMFEKHDVPLTTNWLIAEYEEKARQAADRDTWLTMMPSAGKSVGQQEFERVVENVHAGFGHTFAKNFQDTPAARELISVEEIPDVILEQRPTIEEIPLESLNGGMYVRTDPNELLADMSIPPEYADSMSLDRMIQPSAAECAPDEHLWEEIDSEGVLVIAKCKACGKVEKFDPFADFTDEHAKKFQELAERQEAKQAQGVDNGQAA